MIKLWRWMGIWGLCISHALYADWQDDYNHSQNSAEALKERAAKEFFMQDNVPHQSQYKSYRVHHHKQVHINDISDNHAEMSDDIHSRGLPSHISTIEKVIVVDPVVHAWGAYSANGKLLRAGVATAGSTWCSDIGRSCKTKAGSFRIYSLGSEECVSSIYPIEEGGGAPMPYCMYFNGSQGLHGSDHVVYGNISHGCVRMHVWDARWLRYNFVTQGTKVIIKSY